MLPSTNNEGGFDFDFPAPGEYTIVVHASADQAGPPVPLPRGKDGKERSRPDYAKMAIKVGGQTIKDGIPVMVNRTNPQEYVAKFATEQAGKQHVSAVFLNDYYSESPDPKLKGDRNLYIDYIEVQVPDAVQRLAIKRTLPPSHRRLVIDHPDDSTDAEWDRAAKVVLAPMAKRAFRRPVTESEVTRLLDLTHLARQQKQSFEKGIQLALQAMLVSPSFLFRPEPDAKPNDSEARRQLSDYELATRLAYFLWSSMPDDELLSVAGQGKLKDPKVLVEQANRLLRDPRSRALAENFAGQWLQLRRVGIVQPDTTRFPTFGEPLRQAMRSLATPCPIC